MATKQEIINWFREDNIEFDPVKVELQIAEMIKEGEIVMRDGLYYITEKGYYEFMYGKYKEWESWHRKGGI